MRLSEVINRTQNNGVCKRIQEGLAAARGEVFTVEEVVERFRTCRFSIHNFTLKHPDYVLRTSRRIWLGHPAALRTLAGLLAATGDKPKETPCK